MNEEEAIEFVMNFYNVTRAEVVELYMDEVRAILSLSQRINLES